jgi:glucokinase
LSGLFLDIGGTHFRWVFEDESGVFDTDCDFLLNIQNLVQNYKPSHLGASFAGQVRDGKIMSAPNISTMAIDFESYFSSKYNIECKIDNDLKCAILAESSVRPNVGSIALLYVGTGFGSAFLDSGRVLRGGSNLAGEIGHIPFRLSNRVCGCGKSDCLELFCSGNAMLTRMAELGYTKVVLSDMCKSDDESVKKIVDDFKQGFFHAVSTVISLLNPSLIVFGGGIIKSNPWLVKEMSNSMTEKYFLPAAKDIRFEISSFENGSIEGAKRLFDNFTSTVA